MNDWSTMWESLQGSMGVHIPQLLGALAIFVVGWFVAALVKAGVRKGLGALKLNQRFSSTTGKPVDIEGVVALVLFWVVLLLTLAAVFNALNLALVSVHQNEVVQRLAGWGAILAIPTVILAGPVYARFLKGIDKPIPEGLHNPKTFTEEEMPGFGVSVWTSLVPVILMAMRAVAEMVLPKGHAFLPIAEFFGDPVMATLIAVLIAMFTFGLNRGRSMEQINDTLTSSIKIIAMMLLIIGGGGAFKQVLVDSGMDKYIASIMHESNMSPLFMAWSIAAVLRIALGSATVAAITAGGIAAPLIATTGVSPELMVIAVGSGSVIFSHVNDPGFWLFKEYFNLTIGETIKSWSVLETIISVCGLVGCLLLGMVV